MSTASLPSYRYEPRASENLLYRRRIREAPRGNFSRNTKSGGLLMRLTGLESETSLPEYSPGETARGVLELKSLPLSSVLSVDIKVSVYRANCKEGLHRCCSLISLSQGGGMLGVERNRRGRNK